MSSTIPHILRFLGALKSLLIGGLLLGGLSACADDGPWPNLADPVVRGAEAGERQAFRLEAPSLKAPDGAAVQQGVAPLRELAQDLSVALQDLDGVGAIPENGATWLTARLYLTRVDQALLALERQARISDKALNGATQELISKAKRARSAWTARLGAIPAG